MLEPSSAQPCVLIVADPPRTAELVGALAEPLAQGALDVLTSTGGDDTIDLFEARRPPVVVVTATLADGDAAALVEALRGMVAPGLVAIVLIGDENGPVRSLLDATEIKPDRFVIAPPAVNALRYAVGTSLETVRAARAAAAPAPAAASRDSADEDTLRRSRWNAVPDSFVIEEADGHGDEADPLPPPIQIRPRIQASPLDAEPSPVGAWKPGNTAALIDEAGEVIGTASGIHQLAAGGAHKTVTATGTFPGATVPEPRPPALTVVPTSVSTLEEPPAPSGWVAPAAREPTLVIGDGPDDGGDGTDGASSLAIPSSVTATPVSAGAQVEKVVDDWAGTLPLAQLVERPVRASQARDLDAFDDDAMVLGDASPKRARDAQVDELADLPGMEDETPPPRAHPAEVAADDVPPPQTRDFARQLRAKMSMMAQRLFQGAGDAPAGPAVDLAPRHDHHTEIDLASLAEEPVLDRGVTEIEARAVMRTGDGRDATTAPGTWDSQIRERGLPDTGEVVRGLSDTAMLLAKMFAQGSTGRVGFRRGDAEKVIHFDQGRPVFASSSEVRDRMGELLVREGKITAAQYERCQGMVAESGRRMGEILVDLGYMKRRELLPAVRRHVEDIIYSLFSWDRGTYHIAIDATPCAERIRLSRHPAALILEGVRRKLDRTTLERLLGPPSTVIEVPDRERLGGIINLGDLAPEERGALAAFDAQADLATVARGAGVDVADVLPLAWGLCVLGLATARRTDTEVPDDNTALVGETDLVIDRERVRARWQLVAEADYFALLGVRRDATAFEIRRAYQAARRDFAPDVFPQDLRRELALELDDINNVIDEAFRVLRDDRLRQTYLSNLFE